MPNHETPEKYSDLLKTIISLEVKLAQVRTNLERKVPSDAIRVDGEPASATFYAALVVPVPSDQWEC